MNIEEIKKVRLHIYQIAEKHRIRKVYIFGSVARGESGDINDIDFLIEMEAGASAFGAGGFQYEVQQLLGINVDVIPTFTLSKVEDKAFVQSVLSEAIVL